MSTGLIIVPLAVIKDREVRRVVMTDCLRPGCWIHHKPLKELYITPAMMDEAAQYWPCAPYEQTAGAASGKDIAGCLTVK